MYSGLNFGLRTFNNLIIFGILARIIGLASFGLLAYMITFITLISTVSIFGFRMKIVKEVAVDKTVVNVIYLLRKAIVITILYIIAMVISSTYLYTLDLNVDSRYLILFSSCALFFAMANMMFSFFHAINKFYLETYALLGFTLIQMIGLYGTWITHHMRWFALSYGVGAMVMSILALFFFYYNYKEQLHSQLESISFYDIKRELLLALPFAVISIGDILFNTIDTLVVQAYVSYEELGIYSACLKLIIGLGLISAVAYSALLPTISRLMAVPKKSSYLYLGRIQLIMVGLGLSVCIIFYSFDTFFVNLFLGSEFSLGSQYRVQDFSGEISLFAFTRYCIIVPAIFLIASGSQNKRAVTLCFVIVLSLLSYILLVPIYGLSGAIKIATFFNIILLFTYILLSVLEYRKLKRLNV